MSRIAFFFGLFFLAANLSFAQSSSGTYTFDRTSYDFGVIKANKTATAVFKLTNTGKSPLVILEVGVSCRCTKVDWPRQPIPPGKSTDITINYKDRDTGVFYKTIEITTNSVPRATRLIVKGTIEK